MDIKVLTAALKSGYTVKTVAENEWEIVLNITLPNGFKPKVYIRNMADKWFLCDKKNTLKFMNEMYELGAQDVKNCIAGVLKVYSFSIIAGEIIAHIGFANDILNRLAQFVCCVAELVNMYVFFDKP